MFLQHNPSVHYLEIQFQLSNPVLHDTLFHQELMDCILQINPLFAPTITTVKKKNGAIAMFYPGVLEKLAEICGGSYYVSFTSIHDVRIHPVSTVQPRRILRSLKDVNKMFNQASDILSRQIFVYDNEKKELKPMEM